MSGKSRNFYKQNMDVRFPPEKRLQADWTTAGVNAVLDRLLTDPEVDYVLTLAARGRSTFSELRWYPPMEAAKGSLSWVFQAKQPESVRTGP